MLSHSPLPEGSRGRVPAGAFLLLSVAAAAVLEMSVQKSQGSTVEGAPSQPPGLVCRGAGRFVGSTPGISSMPGSNSSPAGEVASPARIHKFSSGAGSGKAKQSKQQISLSGSNREMLFRKVAIKLSFCHS